jgi:hypothetical protein
VTTELPGSFGWKRGHAVGNVLRLDQRTERAGAEMLVEVL